MRTGPSCGSVTRFVFLGDRAWRSGVIVVSNGSVVVSKFSSSIGSSWSKVLRTGISKVFSGLG